MYIILDLLSSIFSVPPPIVYTILLFVEFTLYGGDLIFAFNNLNPITLLWILILVSSLLLLFLNLIV